MKSYGGFSWVASNKLLRPIVLCLGLGETQKFKFEEVPSSKFRDLTYSYLFYWRAFGMSSCVTSHSHEELIMFIVTKVSTWSHRERGGRGNKYVKNATLLLLAS